MRDITYAVASMFTVIAQFVVAFIIPYLLYAPYANLGVKVGFVFAPLAVLSIIFIIFGIPECRGLSLEEIDHLFKEKVPLRQFSRHKHGEILPEEVREEATIKLGEGPSVEWKEVANQ